MICKHCDVFTRQYNPCTKFVKHFAVCEDFKASAEYKDLDCQKALKALAGQKVQSRRP